MHRAPIRSAAVLGAGTMGAQIAAHLANAGVSVLLLDVTPAAALEGLRRASGLKPDPFFTKDVGRLITTGSFDRDLSRVAEVDWVIEAIIERLDVKQALLARVDAVRHPLTVVSTNTSGIPIRALAEGRTESFRRQFLGTHFFNPPRYLHLVEVIPTADTAPETLARLSWVIDHRLGKGVVNAKDAPGFIANRIGLFGVAQVLKSIESGAFTIEEADAITGPAIGRPKSATCRTLDIAGIDVFAHVATDLVHRLPADAFRPTFEVSPLVRQLVDKGFLGEKSGQGFYKRVGSDILTLDTATLTYRPRQSPALPALDSVRHVEQVGERIRMLYHSPDRVGDFLRATLTPVLVYAAAIAHEVAASFDEIDRALRWGFGWELGPFEILDAIGVDSVAAHSSFAEPESLTRARHASPPRFRQHALPVVDAGVVLLRTSEARPSRVRHNAAASLVDLGDGVLAVDFHSKLNTIGGDTIDMLHAGVKEAAANFRALVVGTDAPDFSAGANLMLLLLESQEGHWDEVELMVRTFQRATMALKYADVPVVVAAAGRVLGGGCEIALHADRVQASAESYIGLVEVGVGLIPAGGGTKEMLTRGMAAGHLVGASALDVSQRVFETLALGRTSTSAAEARVLGYLRTADEITMNRERLLADAKSLAIQRAEAGYVRPTPAPVSVGGESVEAALKLGVHLAWRAGRATDHDVVIGRALAHVVAGGSLPHAALVSEEHLLDLEREAFLRLCGERKTLERIQHTLKTGKPLRN